MGATPRLHPGDLIGTAEVVAVLGPGQPTALTLALARQAAGPLGTEALVVPVTWIGEEDRGAVEALARAGRNSHGVGRRPTHSPSPFQRKGPSTDRRRTRTKKQEDRRAGSRRRRRRRKKTPAFNRPVHPGFRNAAHTPPGVPAALRLSDRRWPVSLDHHRGFRRPHHDSVARGLSSSPGRGLGSRRPVFGGSFASRLVRRLHA